MTETPETLDGAIPGPHGHPVLGMAGAFKRDLLGTLHAGFHEFGDIVEFRIGSKRWNRKVVAVYRPEVVSEVFADLETYGRNTSSFASLGEMFGENLVTTEGDAWRRQRRLLQPLFTPRHVSQYVALMQEEADRLRQEGYVQTNGIVDLVPVLERYALRILSRTLFRGHDGVEEAIEKFERLVPLIGSRVRGRASAVPRLPLGAPILSSRRFLALRKELYKTVDGILARPRKGNPDDLVGRIRAARDPETGRRPTVDEVRNQALIFLVSGHTTTSNAMTFTLYLLGRHPEIQEIVAKSLNQPTIGPGEFDFVRGAVQEAMRLYPSAYAVARRVTADTVLAGHRIKRGTDVMVSPWVTHRHPDFWPHPDDFRPERFRGPNKRPRYAYFPFGGGPRVCIGEHLAMLEATTVIGSLLSRYRVVSQDAELPLAQLVSLRPAGPVRTRWEPR
ncbi:cytochrome P450 [Embleya sp. NPDC050493]|uniref:cytochrome P450 n=1 Tax=Embleya sp. NPDC050493 TaxID=3363989 RepID=UPI0037B3304C